MGIPTRHNWHFQTSFEPGWITLSCGNCGRLRAVPAENYSHRYAGRRGRCRECGMSAPLPHDTPTERTA